jgi:hypothetical protein
VGSARYTSVAPVALLAAIIRLTLGATRAHRRVVSQPNAPLRGPEAAMEYAILNEMLYYVGLRSILSFCLISI